MKNNAYRNSKLKKQLEARRIRGCKEVIWSLRDEQKNFVEQFYPVEKWLYKIKTRYFHNVKDLNPLLKTLHYEKKRGKEFIVCKLKHNELKLLDSHGIKYYPIKYKIHLIE